MPISIPSGRTLPLQSKAGGGFRSLGVGGGVPVNQGDDPHDWQTILTRQGADTLGTTDPTMNLDNILSYEGSFLIPQFKTGDNTFYGLNSWNCLCFKAPDGTNGPNGSIFISGFWYIAELQIPALSAATSHTSLNSATILQNWVDLRPRMPSGNVNDFNKIGWMHFENGKLYIAPYAGYDTNGNTETMVICENPTNLAGSSYSGAFDTWNNDIGSRYICKIPASKQATFGRTHFCGTGPEASIISRLSFGHSLIGVNLADVNNTYQVADSIEWVWHDGNNNIAGLTKSNDAMTNYYNEFVFPAGAYNLLDYWPQSNITTYEAGAGGVADGLLGFAVVPFSTGRATTLHQYPLPPASSRSHALTWESVCGCAFVPPGTDSVVFIGYNAGTRYGKGYKNRRIDVEPPANWTGGGSAGFDRWLDSDQDNFVWSMNLNDVASRVNTYDTEYQAWKPFQDPGPFAGQPYLGTVRQVKSGSYDEINTRLYLGISNIPFNNFEGQAAVSVYQVGSGL
jgi:hypothetical protein